MSAQGCGHLSAATGQTARPAPKPFPPTILCFGDSLTAGYTDSGAAHTPYSTELARRLYSLQVPPSAVPPATAMVVTAGMDGELAVSMGRRLVATLATGAPPLSAGSTGDGAPGDHAAGGCAGGSPECGRPYTHVVLLAGTNDVPTTAADVVVSRLSALHNTIAGTGAVPLAVTLPPAAADRRWPRMAATRRAVNAAIRGGELAPPGVEPVVVDLAAALPPPGQGGAWDKDGLHLSPAGYSLTGGLVADTFLELLEREAGAGGTEDEVVGGGNVGGGALSDCA